jgi:hypothetical protein
LFVHKKGQEVELFNSEIKKLKTSFFHSIKTKKEQPADILVLAEEYANKTQILLRAKHVQEQELSMAFKTLRNGILDFHGSGNHSSLFTRDSSPNMSSTKKKAEFLFEKAAEDCSVIDNESTNVNTKGEFSV